MIGLNVLPGVWTVVGDRAYAHDSPEMQTLTVNDDGSVDMGEGVLLGEGVHWFSRELGLLPYDVVVAGESMIIRTEDFSDD